MDDHWHPATATIVGCRRTFESLFWYWDIRIGNYSPPEPEYVISFTYSVQGRDYRGKYKAGSPQEPGQSFEIMYDPTSPSRNTGTDWVQTPLTKVLIWVMGGAVAALMIWAWNRMAGR